jgi:hypothetical protein
VRIKDAADPHISYSISFSIWEAAVAAGAGLDEIYRLETGFAPPNAYPKWFVARLIAWYKYHNLIIMHSDDAAAKKAASKHR